MIEALWDFFGLYKAGSDYLPGFWLTMLLLYLNAGLYLEIGRASCRERV